MSIPVYAKQPSRLGCTGLIVAGVFIGVAIAYWPWALLIAAVVVPARVVVLRRRRAALLAHGKTLGSLYAMPPEHFEQYIGLLLERLGWEKVRWVGSPGDLGADVTAIDPQGRTTVVQAKRYAPSATVGSPVVQALLGSQAIYHCDRAVLVTTGRFTPAAIDLAAMMDVGLINGRELVEMAEFADLRERNRA